MGEFFFSIIHALSISLSLLLFLFVLSVCGSSFCICTNRTYPCTTHMHESHIVWDPCMHSLCMVCTDIVLHENRSAELWQLQQQYPFGIKSRLYGSCYRLIFLLYVFFFTRSLFHSGRVSANQNILAAAAASSFATISILAWLLTRATDMDVIHWFSNLHSEYWFVI